MRPLISQQTGAGTLGLAKQIGPDLGFHYDHQRGPQRAQHTPHGEDVIDGRIKHTGHIAQLQRGGLVSGQGGNGNENRRARQRLAQLAHQFHRSHGFAHGNGMQPNRARDGLSKGGGQETKAFSQRTEIGSLAQAAPQEIQENGGRSKRLKGAVE